MLVGSRSGLPDPDCVQLIQDTQPEHRRVLISPAKGRQIRVLVVYGGPSPEREISKASAEAVIGALDPKKYDVRALAIPEDGEPPAPGDFASDVVFPVAHGPSGEDGTLQGFLEFMRLPFVGAGVLGSAVGMDKLIMKRALIACDLPVARHLSFRASDVGILPDQVEARLGFPCFIKPANLGSSIGVSKPRQRGDLDAAVKLALQYGEWLLAEEAIAGMEVCLGVLEADPPMVSEAAAVLPGDDFYTFDDKYRTHKAEVLIPAPLSTEHRAQVREMAVRVFRACRCESMARVDFLLEETRPDGTAGRGLIVNEINTLPGLARDSLFPLAWEKSGLAFPELLDRLIELALERRARRRRTQ